LQVKVRLVADVNPTEDTGKVQNAILNLVGVGAVVENRVEAGRLTLVCEGEGLENLRRLRSVLESQRIRDASRMVFDRSVRGDRITVAFNRQAALAGKVSFSESPGDSALGPIWVEIETDDPYELIDWLAPPPGKRRLRAQST